MSPYVKRAKVWATRGLKPKLNRKKRGPKARWEYWYERKSQRSAARQEAKREIQKELFDD